MLVGFIFSAEIYTQFAPGSEANINHAGERKNKEGKPLREDRVQTSRASRTIDGIMTPYWFHRGEYRRRDWVYMLVGLWAWC